MDARVLTAGDEDVATDVITLAFATDPTWQNALVRDDATTDHHAAFWRFFVRGSLPYSLSAIADDGAAVSIWLPADAPEVAPADDAAFERYLADHLAPEHIDDLQQLYDRFEAAHPRTEPHYYLSLLGTHPDHRGEGIGQQLLRWSLDQFDTAGMPTYLESSNTANDHRYQRLGFRPVVAFQTVRGGTTVTGMWRPVGG